jgi:ubiquinone/menaquinone biosynthesis C-methylase UbiE
MNVSGNKAFSEEIARISKVYKERYEADKRKYSLFNPGEYFMETAFERELIFSLKKTGIDNSIQDLRILEVGCGDGKRLRQLQRLGALPAHEYGIELLEYFVGEAKVLSSNCHITHGDASCLPFDDAFFDMVYQRTVFTSIFDFDMKRKIAKEMLRVLKPAGFVLWYDFHMNNPLNSEVRGVKKKEIEDLFPSCDICLRRITLAPPLVRALAPYTLLACYLLEKLPFLCTHYLGVIKKA